MGATYWYSGPSCPKVQFRHVRPPSSERPHPLPTVPYHTAPSAANANAWTKLHEMLVSVVSGRRLLHAVVPGRST